LCESLQVLAGPIGRSGRVDGHIGLGVSAIDYCPKVPEFEDQLDTELPGRKIIPVVIEKGNNVVMRATL
jgi:hypothetical protein